MAKPQGAPLGHNSQEKNNERSEREILGETMPDPKKLKIGMRLRFVSRPIEWSRTDCSVCKEDMRFMDNLIRRRRSCRIYSVDEFGNPWIRVRLKNQERVEHHSWAIFENSGWILVQTREKTKKS